MLSASIHQCVSMCELQTSENRHKAKKKKKIANITTKRYKALSMLEKVIALRVSQMRLPSYPPQSLFFL